MSNLYFNVLIKMLDCWSTHKWNPSFLSGFWTTWKIKQGKRWEPKYHFCCWQDQVRGRAGWESHVFWHRPAYPPSSRHTREAEQNMSSLQVCFPNSSLPRGKGAELSSVYSIILCKITNQIREFTSLGVKRGWYYACEASFLIETRSKEKMLFLQ